MQERVVVVISADLAHTHLSSGPYGYSNASEPFDLVSGLLQSVYTCLEVLLCTQSTWHCLDCARLNLN